MGFNYFIDSAYSNLCKVLNSLVAGSPSLSEGHRGISMQDCEDD